MEGKKSYQSVAADEYALQDSHGSQDRKIFVFGIIPSIFFVGALIGIFTKYHVVYTTSDSILEIEMMQKDEALEKISILDEASTDMLSEIQPSVPDSSHDATLCYLNETFAYEYLVPPYSHQYYLIVSGLDAQINQVYCGLATSAAIINSLRFLHQFPLPIDPIYAPYHYATQTDLFNECVIEEVMLDGSSIWKYPMGVTLSQVEKLLGCFLEGWEVEKVNVDPNTVTLEMMRDDMKNALAEESSRVLINYNRKGVGQDGGGHFSPIGSYHPPSDSFLIMDVAKYKYPPVWAKAEALHKSLASIDTCGQWNFPSAELWLNEAPQVEWRDIVGCEERYRGYIVLRKGKH